MKPLQLFVALAPSFDLAHGPTPRLKASENKRFLVTDDGKPFFGFGDTTWELFHRLNFPAPGAQK